MNVANSGYIHSIHVHGYKDLGLGLHSTIHIESNRGILKYELKSLYTTIRYHNFLYCLRESEFNHKYRNLSNEKIEKFFESYNLIKECEYDVDSLISDDFLNNEDLNNNFDDDDDSIDN